MIGVSVSNVNNSVGGFSSKLAIGKAHSGIANIELRATNHKLVLLSMSPKTDNTETSIYFNPSAVNSGYVSGTTGSWVLGNNIAATSGNAFSAWNPSVQNHHLKLNIDGSSNLYGNVTIGGELVADGGYFNATNHGLFLGTTYAGTDTFANSLNIRDGYLAVYDPALYGYGLVINGFSMVKTNGAHDMVCLAVIILGQDGSCLCPPKLCCNEFGKNQKQYTTSRRHGPYT